MSAELFKAIEDGNSAAVKTLLESGTDANASSEDYDSPLFAISRPEQEEIAACLLAHGARVDIKNYQGITPLMCAAWQETPAMLHMLLEAHADVHARDAHRRTALFHAAELGRTEAVRLLLEYGADPLITNRRGKTALQIALREAASVSGKYFDFAPTIALLEEAETRQADP